MWVRDAWVYGDARASKISAAVRPATPSLSLSRSLCSRQGRKQIDLLGMDGARGAVGVRVPSGVAGKS